MNDNNYVKIPGRLSSVALDGIVSGANEIWDDDLGKKQNQLNQQIEQNTSSTTSNTAAIRDIEHVVRDIIESLVGVSHVFLTEEEYQILVDEHRVEPETVYFIVENN